MIDLHCHILPQVDDGAKNMEEALNMARIAVDNGIRTVVCTPHFFDEQTRPQGEALKEQTNVFRQRLKEENIPLELLWGNEAYISLELVDYVKNHQVLTINDSRYLLMELPMRDMPLYVENIIYELRLEGIIPIIAHPERYMKVMENPEIVYQWIKQGALIQLNAGSLTGRFGPKPKEIAQLLLRHNQVHFIGSDGHSPRSRKPKLQEAVDAAASIIGQEKALRLVQDHGQSVIDDKVLSIEEPLKIMKRTKKFGFLDLCRGLFGRKSLGNRV
ncbi:hypothetical protein QBE52_02690 [Clostridiaceae bacterium 35-E11]